MSTQPPDFLSDDEMARLEAGQGSAPPDFIPDADLYKYEAPQALPSGSPEAVQAPQDTGVFAAVKRFAHGFGIPTSMEELKAAPVETGKALLSYPVPYLPVYNAITQGNTREGRAAGAQAALGPAGAAQYEQFEKAVEAPTLTEKVARTAAGLIPIAGPMAVSPVEHAVAGDYSGAATETALLLGAGYVGHGIAKGGRAIVDAATERLSTGGPRRSMQRRGGTGELPPEGFPAEVPPEATAAPIDAQAAIVDPAERLSVPPETPGAVAPPVEAGPPPPPAGPPTLEVQPIDAQARIAAKAAEIAEKHNLPADHPVAIDAASADFDAGTGLQNKRAWIKEADNFGGHASLDVGGLKWVNDEVSHAAGDQFLSQISAVMDAEAEAAGAKVYRVGGDEFALGGVDEAHVKEVSQRIKERLRSSSIDFKDADGNVVATYDSPRVDYGYAGRLKEAAGEGKRAFDAADQHLKAYRERASQLDPSDPEYRVPRGQKPIRGGLRGLPEGVAEGQGAVDGLPPSAPRQAEGVAPPGGPPEPPILFESIDPETPKSGVRKFIEKVKSPLAPYMDRVDAMGPAGKQTAGVLRRFTETWERGATGAARELTRLQRDFEAAVPKKERGVRFEAVVDMVESKVPTSELPRTPEGKAASGIRAFHEAKAKTYVESGAMDPEHAVENYFPRYAKDTTPFEMESRAQQLAGEKGIPLEDARRELLKGSDPFRRGPTKKVSHLEMERTGHSADYHKTWDVLIHDAMVKERRVAEVRELGKSGDKIKTAMQGIETPEGRDFAQRLVERITGTERQQYPQMTKALSGVRQFKAFGSLGLGSVSQLSSVANTAARGGVMNTAHSMWNIATGGKGIKGLSDLADNYRDAKIEAMPATFANIGSEVSQAWGAGKLTRSAPWLKAVNSMDQMQRVIAYHTAKLALPETIKAAKKGNRGARSELRRMRIDWEKFDPENPEHMDAGAKMFSDYVQVRTRPGELPAFASTPIGKTATQFGSFSYRQGKFVLDAFADIRHGKILPAVRFVVAGALAGNGVGALKDALKGYGINGEDPESVEDGIKKILKGRRVSTDARYAPLWIMQGLAIAGSFGILQDLAQKLARSKAPVEDLLGGPAYEAARDIGGAAVTARDKGLAEGGGKLAGAAARHLVPVFGREIAREMKAKPGESPGRPGWVGRMRDVNSAEDFRNALYQGWISGETDDPYRRLSRMRDEARQ